MLVTRAAKIKARWAILVDKFGLRLSDIAHLTDRQIEEIYFHPRHETTGEIVPVQDTANPTTYLGEALKLDIACGLCKSSPELRAELHEKLKAKWGIDGGK